MCLSDKISLLTANGQMVAHFVEISEKDVDLGWNRMQNKTIPNWAKICRLGSYGVKSVDLLCVVLASQHRTQTIRNHVESLRMHILEIVFETCVVLLTA